MKNIFKIIKEMLANGANDEEIEQIIINNPSKGLEIEGNKLIGIGDCLDQDIIVPSGVTIIDGKCFLNCDLIKTIVFPSTVTVVYSFAFQKCNNLTSIIFSNYIKYIDKYAFYKCPKLKYIDLRNSSVDISSDSFCFCDSLEYFFIPRKIFNIEKTSLSVCKNFKTFYYEGDESELYKRIGGDFIFSNKNLYFNKSIIDFRNKDKLRCKNL